MQTVRCKAPAATISGISDEYSVSFGSPLTRSTVPDFSTKTPNQSVLAHMSYRSAKVHSHTQRLPSSSERVTAPGTLRSQCRWRWPRWCRVLLCLLLCWPSRGFGPPLARVDLAGTFRSSAIVHWRAGRVGVVHRRGHGVHPIIVGAVRREACGLSRVGVSRVDTSELRTRNKPLEFR
jgi:hypothetical protein